MSSILNVSMKEIYEGIKTKRLLIVLVVFLMAGAGYAYWIKSTLMIMGVLDADMALNVAQNAQISSMTLFLAVLGAIFGADAINREVERGTIKVTLSHPIYRDEYLIGKFLGRMAVIIMAFLIFAIGSVAFLLILGVPLSSEFVATFVKMLPFFVIFSLVYLSLGVLLSTFIKKPSTALIVAVILPIFLEIVYPSVVSTIVVLMSLKEGVTLTNPIILQETLKKVYLLLSPVPGYHMDNILNTIKYGVSTSEFSELLVSGGLSITLQPSNISYLEAIGIAWKNIVALVIMFLLPFAIAYAKFMKMELR
ncbi:ABC transporter permease subunit [Thermococcus sp. 2319x1]|uniref:ABC transporter permease subunit n=1 Tax=Thermococcus sp. 2319x1 TaxID=1674923 RepID=UPI00158210AF|nr:ABC transporter permease subunit [Thermococcus sp. 2319x1]